jgi:hypothetical protein
MDHPYLDLFELPPTGLAKTTGEPPLPGVALPPVPQRNPSRDAILLIVAAAYDLQPDDILGSDRHKGTAEARMVTYWLLRTLTKSSFPEIGKYLHRDHTTVMAGVRRIGSRRLTDAPFMTFTNQLGAAVSGRVKGAVAA